MPRRALLLAPIVLIVAAACGGSSATPTPVPTPTAVPSIDTAESVPPVASESPAGSTIVDEAFCGTIADLESTVDTFDAIKVKPANGQELQDQAAKVVTAMDEITQAATASVSEAADTLGTAVDELNNAAADYATNSNGKTEEKRLKSAVKAVRTATTDLRAAAGCTT